MSRKEQNLGIISNGELEKEPRKAKAPEIQSWIHLHRSWLSVAESQHVVQVWFFVLSDDFLSLLGLFVFPCSMQRNKATLGAPQSQN